MTQLERDMQWVLSFGTGTEWLDDEGSGFRPRRLAEIKKAGVLTPHPTKDGMLVVTDPTVEQAERAAERSEALNPQYYADSAYAAGVAHAEALELNAQVVYLYGHGTRAYNLTDVVMYDNGDFLYSVRPLSGGMEWTYDRRPFGTVPFEI